MTLTDNKIKNLTLEPQFNNINEENVILRADSYKYSHSEQYPDNMISMFDYIESRGSSRSVVIGYTRFFGLQYYLQRYFTTPVTHEMVDEARDVLSAHGVPFDEEGWRYIVDDLEGRLPISIRAVPEGTIVPNHNVLVTVESTDSRVPWIVGWAETSLLKAVWYGTTVATRSHKIRTIIDKFMEQSSDNPEAAAFMLQDFGYRGASSEETAGIGGLAHLTNFSGTDTVRALVFARNYYGAGMPAFSVPATEHSTTTSHGRYGEKEFVRRLLKKYGKAGKGFPIISAVADSYNYYEFVEMLRSMKDEIEESGSKFVVRPDSGNPVGNVAYALDHLAEIFGFSANSKGYKLINSVGILQGDGIDEDTLYDILNTCTSMGYSAENLVFGMGGALLQGNDTQSLNRDTFKFAMKASSITTVNGSGEISHIDVYKSPITDMGKVSKRGRLDLILNEDGKYETVCLEPYQESHPNSVLVTVYQDGEVKVLHTLDEIRARK